MKREELREKVLAIDHAMEIVRGALVPALELYFEEGSWSGVENFFLRMRHEKSPLFSEMQKTMEKVWFDEMGFEDSLLKMEQTYLKVRNQLIVAEHRARESYDGQLPQSN